MSLVSKSAPLFEANAVVNGEFKKINLKEYKGKWVVLFFYPLDFTFVCPTEITAMSDSVAEFKKRGVEVIGVSVDSQYSHHAWTLIPRDQGGIGKIEYPLVADITKQIARDYSVLLEEAGVALRATFIIDPEGVIQFELCHDLSVGRNVAEILRNVDALQFAKKYGEVCPAGWTAGKDTIIPDAEKKKQFFSKNGK